MKICCSSRSYARALQSGDLTQLEWIDGCAGLALDGVDLAAAHFPRLDSDYLAQVRKLCADRGLTVAAVCVDDPIGGDADVDASAKSIAAWIARADELGAPLLRLASGSAAGASAGIAWRELIRGLKTIAAEAKAANVTLALEQREGSLVATPLDCKRALKECDSAWLRVARVLAGGDDGSPYDEAVLAIARGGDGDADVVGSLRARGFIGFVTIETAAADEDSTVRAALSRLRAVRA